MQMSKRMKDETAFVSAKLAGKVICNCGATLDTYGARCTADLSEPCAGFQNIEDAKAEFATQELNRKQSA